MATQIQDVASPTKRPEVAGQPLFRLEGLTKRYGKVTALDGLSVEMPAGAVGLLGPNGAGKTTMIRSILGLIGLDKGEGEVLGVDIRRHPLAVRQVVGFAPEDECLFPGVDGVGFVAYAGELTGMDRSDAMQRAHEVLDYVVLGEARYRQADSYSTGMKQRLKIASAIVHDPKLLILDEPTNGMDPAGRIEIIELARDLAYNKGMSLLFSSHLLPDVEAVCDHVMVMGAGRLLANGRIKDLKQRHNREHEVRLKGDNGPLALRLTDAGLGVQALDDLLIVSMPEGRELSEVWAAAAEVGAQVRHLRPRQSSLEDVFLSAIAHKKER